MTAFDEAGDRYRKWRESEEGKAAVRGIQDREGEQAAALLEIELWKKYLKEHPEERAERRFDPLTDEQMKRLGEHVRVIFELQKKLGLEDKGIPRNS